MNITILHAHTENRGDEAAVKAMVDELLKKYPEAHITVILNGVTQYPNMDKRVLQISRIPIPGNIISKIEFALICISKGKVTFTKEGKRFIKYLKNANLIIHAPGGPSIGDIYNKPERLYLERLNLAYKMHKPYIFYAPSMGPFKYKRNNKLRRKILKGAEKIILRDPVSIGYLKDFIPGIKAEQALDSAMQHDIDIEKNKVILEKYHNLTMFLKKHPKTIGLTITDLKWHPIYGKTDISKIVCDVFSEFINKRIKEGYGIVFIPQLYGSGNDTKLMNRFMAGNDTFIIDADNDIYDTYFQQYLISQLYAVVGMRYHSNIFSAKMATPFISISYEQKMEGFMKTMALEKYCLVIDNLTIDSLEHRFILMIQDYDDYQHKLNLLHNQMKADSYRSTQAVIDILEEIK